MKNFKLIVLIFFITLLHGTSNPNYQEFYTGTNISEIQIYRNNMDLLLNYMENDTFLDSIIINNDILPTHQKEHYKQIWGAFWHYFDRINTIKNKNRNFYKINPDEINHEMFMEYYFALTTFHSYGSKLINICEKYKDFDVILNEKFDEIPYPKDSYDILKKQLFMFRTPLILSMNKRTYLDSPSTNAKFDELIRSDLNYLSSAYYKKSFIMSLKNTIGNLDEDRFALWYPIQKNLAKIMANIKVWRRNEVFITDDLIENLHKILQPGDIILQRREWVLTNLLIPGYWTHSALYIGTQTERSQYFRNDSLVVNWLKDYNHSDFNKLLKDTYSSTYGLSIKAKDNRLPTIIESVEEGVIFNTLRQSALCDGIVILRPKLNKMEKALAIYNAFNYTGRPYDYDFNFLTDSSLICTELLYKSFEPNEKSRGLSFDIKNVRNRKLLSANDIACEFDREYDTPNNQLEFVAFYDVSEKEHKAVMSKLEDFRKSWKRSKFHFLFD